MSEQMRKYGSLQLYSQPKFLHQPDFFEPNRNPYPFLGTVLMGSLLNIAIFKLSPRTNAIHFVAIGILGSLGVNSMHAILKLAGHTKSPYEMDHSFVEIDQEFDSRNLRPQTQTRSPSHLPQHESHFDMSPEQPKKVYDSNLRLIHLLIVKPLSRLSEFFIGPLTTTKGIRDIASGVFHHIGPKYTHQDGRRDIQLFIAGVVTAIALKKMALWFKPSLQADWQTVCTAVVIPTLWAKSTQLSQPENNDPGKPWSWIQSIMETLSEKYRHRKSDQSYL